MTLKPSVFKPVSVIVALWLVSCHDSHFTPIIERPIDQAQASKMSVPKNSEVQNQRIFESADQLVVQNSPVEPPSEPVPPDLSRPAHKKKKRIVQLWKSGNQTFGSCSEF